ncbi:MAG: hypothetical protein A4E69_01537 [Syntrophus sp. PtaB.Bin138]|nr:MAG: hypothetical protein A4E69_01537 [Syntrophus sp. PtaB.Bin138]
MLIPVIYCDHTHGTVESFAISRLLREGKILSFKRASGWVIIGRDRIRKLDHAGQERSRPSASHDWMRNNPHEAIF